MRKHIFLAACVASVAACEQPDAAGNEALGPRETTAVAAEDSRPLTQSTICGHTIELAYQGPFARGDVEQPEASWDENSRLRLREVLESNFDNLCDSGTLEAENFSEVEVFTFGEMPDANIVGISYTSEHDETSKFPFIDIPSRIDFGDELDSGMEIALLCAYAPNDERLEDGLICLPD